MSKKLITLSVGLIAATTLVFGQQKDSLNKNNKPENSLDDVIVTANKISQKQNTTGKVVTIITAEQITQNAGRTVAQILNDQAGLYLPGSLSNAGTVPSIYMRGASSGRTLILIDGAPVGDPSMISNEFDLNLIPLSQVERIEILKGAQSTMYGSDAIGGVINIITKNKGQKFITGELSTGTYGAKNASLQLNSSLHNINYSIGLERQKADGFSSAVDKNNTGKFDKDGYENKSWFLKLQKDINVNWSVNAYTRKTAYIAAIDYGAFKDDKDDHFKNATTLSGLTLKYKKANKLLQFQYQYTTQNRTYRNDSVDKTYTIFEDNRYAGKSHFADLFLSNSLSKNIRLILGTDFRYSAYNQSYLSISAYGPWIDNFKDTFQFQNSLYSSLLINDNSNKWVLEIGGRYNHHSRYGGNQTFTVSPSYKLTEQVRLLASISTGFKAPSLYQLSYNSALAPEKSFNTEIGTEFKTNSLFARAVYFNRTIDNGIDYNYINYNFFNFIKQKVNGLELELNWKPIAGHTISANYTLMNGQETNQNRITTTDTITYNYLLKRPKHSGGIQWQYIVNPKLDFSIAARFTSNRYDVGGYAAPDILLNYYTLVNAHIQYKMNNHFTLFADGQNLGNAHFQEINGYNTIGRRFLFGIRLR